MKGFLLFLFIWVAIFGFLFLIAGGKVISDEDFKSEYEEVN